MDFISKDLENFTEQLPMGVFILNHARELQLANSRAIELWGLAIDDLLIPRSFDELLNNRDISQAITSARNNAISKQKLIIEHANRPLACTISITSEMPDSEQTIIIIMEDATEIKRLETVKREFISSILHRLRSPLSTLKTSLAMLTRMRPEEITDHGKEILEMGYHEVNRLHQITDDLRDLFNIETGLAHKEFELEDFRISEVLGRAIIEMRRLPSPFSGIEKRLLLQGDLNTKIHGDFARLKQVLINLFKNACAYSPGSDPIVAEVTSNGSRAGIQIQDKGIGIADNRKQLAFTRYFREDNAITKKINGNGLGLYISRAFMELMGGDITLESEQNHGTTVTISIPLAKELFHEPNNSAAKSELAARP